MQEIQTFVSLLQSGGVLVLLVILAIPKFKKKVFGNGNSKELAELRDNHLHTLQESMNEIKKGQDGLCDKLTDIQNTLSNLEKYGIKIRK